MSYTIQEVSRKTGLSVHTLRYYDKEKLLPDLGRSASGTRRFSDQNIEWINFITCLKNCGMSIQQIKDYTELCRRGDETLHQRLEIFLEQRKKVTEQLNELQHHLDVVNFKIKRYTEECKAYELKMNND